ncbi:hypothetical protein CXF83_06460 [Shewanella sp. Choline-02u-19]|nr:hypothetical protein CXF82_03965 [Shewanella sp. GutDb-MelDb]PKH56724.1 hypothetical protein CXF84_12480 [Shewanella sp. Bg11-22]PKI30275.1 hypothetical protein CXF83_06460 [Shewanella sp. Choline-02u-19]
MLQWLEIRMTGLKNADESYFKVIFTQTLAVSFGLSFDVIHCFLISYWRVMLRRGSCNSYNADYHFLSTLLLLAFIDLDLMNG